MMTLFSPDFLPDHHHSSPLSRYHNCCSDNDNWNGSDHHHHHHSYYNFVWKTDVSYTMVDTLRTIVVVMMMIPTLVHHNRYTYYSYDYTYCDYNYWCYNDVRCRYCSDYSRYRLVSFPLLYY